MRRRWKISFSGKVGLQLDVTDDSLRICVQLPIGILYKVLALAPLNTAWSTMQVELGRDGSHPVEDTLVDGRPLVAQVIGKLRLMCELGWPLAQSSLTDYKGRRLIVRITDDDPALWELKIKPSCWRMYFYVDQRRSFFVFVHAVCKKQTAEDGSDPHTAERRLRQLLGGGAGDCIASFPLEAEGAS